MDPINRLLHLWSRKRKPHSLDAPKHILVAKTAALLRKMAQENLIKSNDFIDAIERQCGCGCKMPDIDLLQAAVEHLTTKRPVLPERCACATRYECSGSKGWRKCLHNKEMELDVRVVALFRESLPDIIDNLRSGAGVAETVEQTPESHHSIKGTSTIRKQAKRRRPHGWWRSTLLPKLESQAIAATQQWDRCPTRRQLAKQYDCSTAQIQKCFDNSEVLKEWEEHNALYEGVADSNPMLTDQEVAEALQKIEQQVPRSDRQALREQIKEMDTQKLAELFEACE